ncbi:MAG: glycosyltransferase family 2 protein [Actinomycetota bacterium]|nr:MAG: glycosyltransferase family 2 protein [Actinomycetota bacterium]
MTTDAEPGPDASAPAEPPGVSVVIPVLDEERHLAEAVARVLAQQYAGPLEVVLALGPSRDRTDEVAAELAAADHRVRAVDNPSGRTPHGLNAAVRAASYDVVVRVDGHALIPHDYVAVAVETLARTGADNVGGVMAAEGVTPFERAVARAMTTRLGVGGVAFHVGGQEGPAPTVYLGAFRRSAIEQAGGYDESMLRAQDWELNHRIRAAGGTVWFTPRMRVTYRPRGTVRSLARQYFHYGRWRREVARRHPDTLSPRYLAAPVAVVGVGAGIAAGVTGALLGSRLLRAGWLAPAAYVALVVGGAALNARGLPPAVAARLPVVYAVMHGAWGVGFLTSPPDLAQRDR